MVVHLPGENPLGTAALIAAEARQTRVAAPAAPREQIGSDMHSLDATIDSLRAARFSKARFAKARPRDAHQRPTRAP